VACSPSCGKLVLLRKDGKPATSPRATDPYISWTRRPSYSSASLLAASSDIWRRLAPTCTSCNTDSAEVAAPQMRSCGSERSWKQPCGRAGWLSACRWIFPMPSTHCPGTASRGALQHHGVPLYLRRVLRGYFTGRSQEFRGEDGASIEREVHRRVSPRGQY